MKNIITQNDIENTVTIRNGQEVVRSDKLAKMFGKQHKGVLEKIRNIIRDFPAEFSARKISQYFIEEQHENQAGKYTRFYLTRKGFDLVGLSLTGKKALQYKLWYIDAFYDKQRVIEEHKLTAKLNKQDDLWVQFREEGKVFRNKLTDAIRVYIVKYREDNEQKLNDGKYFTNYTNLIYKALNINLPKGANPRDVLDKRMLVRLEDLEDKVADMIKDYADKGIYYKDVYKIIKRELTGIKR